MCSQTQALQYVSIGAHTPVLFLYQGHQTCTPTHPLSDLWVLLSVSVCAVISMSTLFSCRRAREEWVEGDVVVVVLRGGGFPCVYLGRVVNIKAPPLPLMEQTKALLPSTSAGSRTYHSGCTGALQPPHWLNGHSVVEGGMTRLTWAGKVCSQMCHSLNDAFKGRIKICWEIGY